MSTVGIVGPDDLVESVAATCTAISSLEPIRFPYHHETETAGILKRVRTPDSWLFTGIVPYEIAQAAGLLTRPATYVDYTGATLLRALVDLLREGHDITATSIDTLAEAEVAETLADAGVPPEGVRVLEHRPNMASDALVAFHRRCYAEAGTRVAVTCLRSTYETLRAAQMSSESVTSTPSLAVYHLAPVVHSVRNAVQRLVLLCESAQTGDAQVALGLVRIAKGHASVLRGRSAALRSAVISLGGCLASYDDEHLLIVTTRGPLEVTTRSFRELAMLGSLTEHCGPLLIGFGIGRSAAEAEALAKRAMSRAWAAGPTAAVVSLRNGIDILLASEPDLGINQSLGAGIGRNQLARRAGLSVATLSTLADLARHSGEAGMTSRDVANRVGVQPRTARRMLNRLQRAGVARIIGTKQTSGRGRPLVIYRLDL